MSTVYCLLNCLLWKQNRASHTPVSSVQAHYELLYTLIMLNMRMFGIIRRYINKLWFPNLNLQDEKVIKQLYLGVI